MGSMGFLQVSIIKVSLYELMSLARTESIRGRSNVLSKSDVHQRVINYLLSKLEATTSYA